MSNIKYFPHTLAHNKFKIKSVAYGYVDCEARIAKMCRLCEFAIPDLVWNVPHTILTEPGFLVAADHRCDLHLLMYVDVRILCVVTLPCRHGVSSILFLAPISWHDRLPYMQETQPSNFDSLKALAKIIAPTFWLYWWRLCSCSLISLILFSTFCVFFFLFFFDGNNINFSMTSQLCAWCEMIHVCTLFISKSSWLCRLTWYLLHLYIPMYWYCTYINCGNREMCRFGA